MMGRERGQRWVVRTLQWLGLLTMVFTAWGVATPGRARINPYHVVKGAVSTEVKPKILFVLDTSGSMQERTDSTGNMSLWYTAENPTYFGTQWESRISAARRVVNAVVTAKGAEAKFALMTFDQLTAHTNNAPSKCGDGYRFQYVYDYVPEYGGYWQNLYTQTGQQGAWKLCQGNRKRPYPYLRWDDLGRSSVIGSNNAAGPVPPSPLIDPGNYFTNRRRKVQWFPEFMGIRWQPNDTTDPGRVMTHASVGDYGDSKNENNANVWREDFYYWPYVDGFPGYGAWLVYPYNGSGEDNAGVTGEDTSATEARLYAPFYLDLNDTPVNPNYWGPQSQAEAEQRVLWFTSPMIEGGVDAQGGTPWKSVIGPIPAAPSQSNAINAHPTVSSYVKFVSNIETPDVCAPIAVVLLTDGVPSPSNQGGSGLYRRLADLRTDLKAQTFVVGMYTAGATEINDMACAAAGACDGNNCGSPCNDTPAEDWDTCFVSGDPSQCAWLTNSTDELEKALGNIIDQILGLDVETGSGAVVNEFGTFGGDPDETQPKQTRFRAWTEVPEWRGHVERRYCDDVDELGDLEEYCVPPSPEFEVDESQPTFGPCLQSRAWDAGECLKLTAWTDRRLYTHDASNNLIPIAEADGSATAAFVALLQSEGAIASPNLQFKADEIAAFVLGRDAPDGWKLPGLANSAPVVVRRIPELNEENVPEVPIRDPHCGGRYYNLLDAGGLPQSLYDFAERVWDVDDANEYLPSPAPHYKYQEAVVIGDDMGVLHAFQLDSGNELWGFIPRFALQGLAEQAAIGPDSMGQPSEIADHKFGIAASLNHGWVHDDGPDDLDNTDDDSWRHLGIIGMGAGGAEFMALDLSHMSPEAPEEPLEVLWTTEDPALEADYDPFNGETWARPALSYWIENEAIENPPDSFLVMGTGYDVGGGGNQGRVLMRSDALTGEILEQAVVPAVTHDVYEPDYGTVVDAAVGSHCISRYWAEAQETYIADPAGRLFRWDLGRDKQGAGDRADSGGVWGDPGTASVVDPGTPYFPACQGTGDTCTVQSSNRGDVFIFPPAVSANDRIDDFSSVSSGLEPIANDQFLVALVSGSQTEDQIDGETTGLDFHSSLYLLVDDHSSDPSGGFSIPAGAPKSVGALSGGDVLTAGDATYFRAALTDILRTRVFTPYDGADEVTDTANFSRKTRPVRAPRIFTVGAVDDSSGEPQALDDIEVVYIEYTVYEPPTLGCNTVFYDPDTETWHEDRGSTFTLRFRLTSSAGAGFNFNTGSSNADVDFGGGFERGLVLDSVDQVCGNCAPQPSNLGGSAPCEAPVGGEGGATGNAVTAPVRSATIEGFTPVE